MLVRYRAGSLDRAMAAFRDRNLLLGGSVLVVLALGIVMLVVLTERARALAETQAEFALGVSHELRTPLTVIRVAADNLAKGIVENSPQARQYGEIIRAHATELSHMIEDTLEFARLRSPSLLLHASLVPPGEIVQAALADAAPSLRESGIECELHLAPDLPPIEADPALLKRSLANLIQNVVKYAAAGRWMAVRADKTLRPEGERVRISVEDRGPGIAPPDRRHLFEPFYRGKRPHPAQTPGVGLGLTLVKRVVQAHHGSVEFESSETAGTRFSILLPPGRERPEPPAEP
jgi:signal transduction histidine kinase